MASVIRLRRGTSAQWATSTIVLATAELGLDTTLNKLKTHILLEENFAGTFDGAISQFRFYTEPLSAPEVKHNFKLLKNKFRAPKFGS